MPLNQTEAKKRFSIIGVKAIVILFIFVEVFVV